MKPILIDKSGEYPVYLYHPDFSSSLPLILNEVHIKLYTDPRGHCKGCNCDICPLQGKRKKYYCGNLTLYAIKYPELTKTYPELFL